MRKIIALTLAATAVIVSAVAFAAVSPMEGTQYKEMKAFDIETASKKTVGFFTKAGNACNLRLATGENINAETGTPTNGSVISFTLAAGADARMQDSAGGTFTVTCGNNAANVVVKIGNGAS